MESLPTTKRLLKKISSPPIWQYSNRWHTLNWAENQRVSNGGKEICSMGLLFLPVKLVKNKCQQQILQNSV